MDEKEYLYRGWDFAAKLAGADFAANDAANYVSEVQKAIEDLEKGIRDLKSNQTDASLGGFLAEEWHARTFNIDAIADGSAHRAVRLGDTGYGSVDIHTNFGKDLSGKYLANAEKSATAQALLNRDTRTPLYEGQERLIPSDQLTDAKAYANREAARNAGIRPDVSDSYSDASRNLVDRIKDSDGHESRPLKKTDDLQMAKDVKNDEFTAEKYGVDLKTAIKADYIIDHALKAGLSAAAISVAMQVTPEIMKAIDYLIKHGELDLKQVKKVGTKAISSGSEGFLRGSIACTVQILCEQGVLGEVLKNHADPTIVGAVVAIILQTAKNSILVAAGKMTAREMGSSFVDSVIVSAGFIAGMKAGQAIGGAIGQAIGIELPGLGYAIGSLIGCTCAVVYQVGKRKLISFCVDTGFTCFGLVEQDYQLPDDILNDMGLDLAEIDYTPIDTAEINRNEISDSWGIDVAELETVDLKIVRRGVIGVNKVGFVV